MIAINFNTISDFHWDEKDEENCFCILITLGDYEGDKLCFPQLNLIIPLKPGQILLFRSRLLLHGNCILTKGIRHSIVYHLHKVMIKQGQSMIKKIYDDFEKKIERNNKGKIIDKNPKQNLFKAPQNLPIKKFTKPKSFQTKMELSNDQRRLNIGK